MTQSPPKIYLGDKFNSNTGKPLATIPKVKTLDEIQPEAVTQLKKFFPDGAVYTGVVDRVFYYRRLNKSINGNIIVNYANKTVNKTVTNEAFSYFWIDLRDSDGNVHHFSVNAEDEAFQNLKKGDILTAIFFESVTLSYKVERGEAQRIVSHDRMVCAAIVHDDTQNIPYIHPQYVPEERNEYTIALVAGFIGLIIGWFSLGFVMGFVVSAVAGFATCPIDIARNRKRFKENEEAFNAIESIVGQLATVSKRDLGYEFLKRPKHRADVICVECDSRISPTFSYCVYCGAKQTSSDAEVASTSSESSQKTLAAMESEDVTPEMQQAKASPQNTSSRNTISAIEDALLAEFTINYKKEYTQKANFFFEDKTMVNVTCIMAKVLDRHNEVDVSNSSNTVDNRYVVDIYRNYSDDLSLYDRSETRGLVTKTNTRSSKMNSLFVLQLEGGKVIQTQLPDDISADLDVGDWFVLAEYTAEFEHPLTNREFAMNINKDKQYRCSKFENYKAPTLFKEWFFTFVLIVAFNIYYKNDVGYFPIIIFSIISIVGYFKSISVSEENRRNRQKVMAPLDDLISSLQAKTEEVKSTIRRIA